MKKISLNLDSLKASSTRFFDNFGYVFFVAFLILICLEIYEIKNSVNIVLDFRREPPPVATEKGVRINFDSYNQAVKRIEQSAVFQPTGGITKNPFQAGK